MAEKDLSTLRWELNSEYYFITRFIQDRSITHRSRLPELIINAYRAVVFQPISQYDGILHIAHQYANIQTSIQIVQALGNTSDARMNQLLKGFGECLMNDWDPLSLWDDILIWRHNFITDLLRAQPSRPLPLTPHYPILALSRGARQQGLPLVAAEYLRLLPTSGMNSYELFERWKEQALICLDLPASDRSVLAELENLRFDAMKESQRSYTQYLYGLYALKEKKNEEANGYLSKAVQLDTKNKKALESLSQLLYQQWKEVHTVASAQQCLNCFFQQLLQKSEAMKVMPRFLHVAQGSLDNQQLFDSISSNGARIPYLFWIPFLPFLFSQPAKALFVAFTPVITMLIKKMPQTVFYPLRTLCLSLGMEHPSIYATKSAPPCSIPGPAGMNAKPSEKTVDLATAQVEYFILLSTLSKSISQLLLLVDTLESVPRLPFRELLADIDSVLSDIYRIVSQRGFAALVEEVGDALRQRLDRMCAKHFSVSASVPSTLVFIKQYSTAFVRDFSSTLVFAHDGSEKRQSNPYYASSLQELLQRLLLWKRVAVSRMDEGGSFNLFEELLSYSHFIPGSLEIPGQHSAVNPAFSSTTIQSIHFHRPTLYQEQHGWRYVDMIAEQNKVHRFYLEEVSEIDRIVEERSAFFQLFFSALMTSQPTQMRHLQTSLVSCVPISPTLRLVQGQQYGSSLEGVYRSVLKEDFDERQCDFALRLFVLNHPDAVIPPEYAEWAKTVTKETLFSSVCDECVLSKYM